jgi:septum formation protein
MRLVLASASPRRAELLTAAGFHFDVAPADVDETPYAHEAAADYAMRVARDKAAAASARHPDAIVLAADTVVVADGVILGKPTDRADAVRMLQLLSGTTHVVQTAVVLRADERDRCRLETTRVHFRPLGPDEIAWYVETGEPVGKAGAYGIQGAAARFIDWIEGSWSNVVGLPVAAVYQMLDEAGFGDILRASPSRKSL